MKKIKFLLSLMLVFIFALYLNVYSFAYYEQYAHEAPGGTAGQWVSGAFVSDMVASDTPVYPDMVAFYYKPSTIKSLPTTFANSSTRAFYMYVMEDDVGDYDDYVKYYTGTFSGRTLSGITFSHTCTDDSIEAFSGIELYIKQYVGTASGDSSTTYTTLFSYYFGVD